MSELSDELAVALELDGDAVHDLIKRTFDLAYTYTCETGSTSDNAIKRPGAFEMRWSGHLDPRLLTTQIFKLLAARRADRAESLWREVGGE